MTFWIDAQLSPALAVWLRDAFDVEAYAVRELGLRDAVDTEIYFAARAADAVVLTKDSDFVELLHRCGPPPRIIWITCGNTSNVALWQILTRNFERIRNLLESGEHLVEVR